MSSTSSTGGATGSSVSTATTTATAAPPASTHVPILHVAAALPGPTGDVPKLLDATSKDDQRKQADGLFAFLTSADPALARLNEGNDIFVALVNVPKTSLVKVVYGLGLGSSPIGSSVSAVDGKLLMLHGDGNKDIGPPQPLVLPSTMVEKHSIATMTEAQFSSTLTAKGAGYSYPLLPRASVTTSLEMMQLAPIPPYLVYDGFHENLDAACVLERILVVNPTETPWVKHLKSFLKACLSAHNSPDNKPYIIGTDFTATPSVVARQWALQAFARLCPSLKATTTAPPPTVVQQPPDIAAIVAAVTAASASTASVSTITTASTKTDDVKLSKGELQSLLRMCGKASTGTVQDLPQWVQECTDKGNSDAYKHTIVQKYVMATVYYEDADVPLTSQLLKMLVKRSWTGKDGNINRPSMLHAMEGLTPFAMRDLNEDEVARLNDEQDLLNSASLVSVADLRGQRNKDKISIPTEAADFMLMLKRYANFLFAAFSETCPLFHAVREVVRALREYSREARKRMSLSTKASILWIILLQSRQFSLGEVNLLCEFTTMHEDLRAKRASIHHSEVPNELITNSTPEAPPKAVSKKTPSPTDPIDVDKIPKKPKTVPNPNNWHPKLKEALEEPLKKAGHPSFTKVMNFCKKDAYGIFHKGSPICVPNAFFGTCFFGDKCPKKHTMATDAQVQPILSLLDDFIRDPAKIKSG